MRVTIEDGWTVDLPGDWTADPRPTPTRRRRRRTAEAPAPTWRAAGRTLSVGRLLWWCTTNATGVIASLDATLPPHPAGKVAEPGRDGIGVRAAWFYRDTGGARLALHGYTFTDQLGLETVLTDADDADPAWLFAAWRSVARSR